MSASEQFPPASPAKVVFVGQGPNRTAWGRWQHHVNYKVFRGNKLVPRPGAIVEDGANNYGMELKVLTDAERAAGYAVGEEQEEPPTEPLT